MRFQIYDVERSFLVNLHLDKGNLPIERDLREQKRHWKTLQLSRKRLARFARFGNVLLQSSSGLVIL